MRSKIRCTACRGSDTDCGNCAGAGWYYGDGPGWDERINDAEARGGFTEEDCENAKEWEHCAVGERPADPAVKELGVEFYHKVQADDVEGARDVRKQILDQ